MNPLAETSYPSLPPIHELNMDMGLDLDDALEAHFEALQTAFIQFCKEPSLREKAAQTFEQLIADAGDARFDALRSLLSVAKRYVALPERVRRLVHTALSQQDFFPDYQTCLESRLVLEFIKSIVGRGFDLPEALPLMAVALNQIPDHGAYISIAPMSAEEYAQYIPTPPIEYSEEQLTLEREHPGILEALRNLIDDQPIETDPAEAFGPVQHNGEWYLRRR